MTVYAKDLNFQTNGQFQTDYITVEHSVGLDLQPEMIMKGFYDETDKWFKHSVYSLKKPEEFIDKPVVVHEYSHNIYAALAQFEKPFDYSTSSWHNGGNYCNKNASRFKFEQPLHHEDAQSIKISVRKPTRSGNAFGYSIMSDNFEPKIGFSIPG